MTKVYDETDETKTVDTGKEAEPLDPKFYAPVVVKLEADFPKLAEALVGIGDQGVDYDGRKRLITAHFQSTGGTKFHGAFVSEPSSLPADTEIFLDQMVKKLAAVEDSDKRIVDERDLTQRQLEDRITTQRLLDERAAKIEAAKSNTDQRLGEGPGGAVFPANPDERNDAPFSEPLPPPDPLPTQPDGQPFPEGNGDDVPLSQRSH